MAKTNTLETSIEALSFDELDALKGFVEELHSKRIQEERNAAIQQAEEALKRVGLSFADMTAKPKTVAKETHARAPVAPKYRSPDGKETWAGRGRKPSWLQKELDAGKSVDDFKIQ